MLTARQALEIMRQRASLDTPLPPTRSKEKHRRRKRRIKLNLKYGENSAGDLIIVKRK